MTPEKYIRVPICLDCKKPLYGRKDKNDRCLCDNHGNSEYGFITKESMTTPQEIIKEFDEKFPPPMLLGQNQEQLRLFIISTVIKQYEEMLEEVEKEINEDYPSGVDEDTVGQWECGYYKRLCDNRLSIQSKIKEWKLID